MTHIIHLLFENFRNPRLSSGIVTALIGGVLALSYLELLFTSVAMPLATVALYILVITSASIGMCLGLVLPIHVPGLCFGVSFATLLGFFLPSITTA